MTSGLMIRQSGLSRLVNVKTPRVVILSLILFTQGCREQGNTATKPDDGDLPSTTKTAKDPTGLIGRAQARSTGQFEFIDQHGLAFTNKEIAGKLAIVNFIFTTCPGTCPRQSKAMKALQERLQKTAASGIQLISISVDPKTDTPRVLLDYASHYAANLESWSFLTGDQNAIWAFSKDSMGMAVAPNPNDPLIPIAHESKFALIDRTGKIRGYFDALEESGFEQLWTAIDIVLPEFEPDAELLRQYKLPDNMSHIAQPANILDSGWLAKAAHDELSELQSRDLTAQLKFEECVESTGITFTPQIVDDQRHRLLVNHYDHGNSVSIADIDGDGLLDLYFTSQVGPNELWRCTGNGQFENITEKAGVGLVDRLSVAASFCDIDNDGDPDLFVTSIRSGNVLLENDGAGRFTDITAEAGLSYFGHSSSATFFDYDLDGLPDLYLCNVGKFTTDEQVSVRHDITNSQPATNLDYFVGRPDAFAGHLLPELTEHSILYRNVGDNRFEDVTKSAGLGDNSSWSGTAIVFDANNDNWQDLYVCNMQGHDHLYINHQGMQFVDETIDFFEATPWGTMGATVFDFDNNGLFDLFLTDMHSDMSQDVGPELEKQKSAITWPEEFLKSKGRSIYGNAFFKQVGRGKYEEVSDAINAENYWPWGLSNGDFDADGFQDVFVCSSMCFPYRYSVNSLLWNSSGQTFVDSQFTAGIEPRRPFERLAPWFSLNFSELDADSRLRQGREGECVVWSATGTRSCAVFDFDNDGDLDIVTNEFNTRPQVFRNESPAVQFLKIELHGTVSGHNAWGTIVSVETTSGTTRQLHNGASGYLSQSVTPLYFGLGKNSTVKKVHVLWPNSQQQIIEGPLAANQLLKIVQPN